MSYGPQSIEVSNVFKPGGVIGSQMNYIKVHMSDGTITNTANASLTNGGTEGILDNLFHLIALTTEPFVIGSPYSPSGSDSAVLFVVRADAGFVQATLQTAVQAITGLSSATVTISTTLVG